MFQTLTDKQYLMIDVANNFSYANKSLTVRAHDD